MSSLESATVMAAAKDTVPTMYPTPEYPPITTGEEANDLGTVAVEALRVLALKISPLVDEL